jgi:hypothetical protein
MRFQRFLFRHHLLQDADERRSGGLQFLAVNGGELAQGCLALVGQAQQHLTPVDLVAVSRQQATLFRPVNECHSAVVLDLEPFGDIADGDLIAAKPLDGEQQLVLLGLEPGGTGRFLAKALEFAQLIAEFGQNPVIWGSQGSAHRALLLDRITTYAVTPNSTQIPCTAQWQGGGPLSAGRHQVGSCRMIPAIAATR